MIGTEIAVGFTSLGVLLVANITTVAYQYGKLNQKVKDNSERLERIENNLNGYKVRKK